MIASFIIHGLDSQVVQTFWVKKRPVLAYLNAY
jgi:hypothetical protein